MGYASLPHNLGKLNSEAPSGNNNIYILSIYKPPTINEPLEDEGLFAGFVSEEAM